MTSFAVLGYGGSEINNIVHSLAGSRPRALNDPWDQFNQEMIVASFVCNSGPSFVNDVSTRYVQLNFSCIRGRRFGR